MSRNSTKPPLSSFYLFIYFWLICVWALGLLLCVIKVPIEILFTKTIFSFAISCQLEIVSLLWMGACAHFPFSALGLRLPWTCGGCFLISTVSVSHMYFSNAPVPRRCCFFSLFHSYWFLQSNCLLFLRALWTLKGGAW